MFDQCRALKAAGVDAVNVPDGPRAQSRMGALLSAVLIEREVGLEAVCHYCCRDRNLLGMLSDLLGAAAAGIRNLLLVTGDPPKMGPYPDATAVFDIDSIGLTNLVTRLNRGLDPGGNPLGAPTKFAVGVGVNPAAPDLERELSRFAWKVDAGAEFAITQPVFDLKQLDRFLTRVESFRIPDHRRDLAAGVAPERGVPGQRGAGGRRCPTRSSTGCGPRANGARKRRWPRGCRSRARCWPRFAAGWPERRSRRRSAGCPWRSRSSDPPLNLPRPYLAAVLRRDSPRNSRCVSVTSGPMED